MWSCYSQHARIQDTNACCERCWANLASVCAILCRWVSEDSKAVLRTSSHETEANITTTQPHCANIPRNMAPRTIVLNHARGWGWYCRCNPVSSEQGQLDLIASDCDFAGSKAGGSCARNLCQCGRLHRCPERWFHGRRRRTLLHRHEFNNWSLFARLRGCIFATSLVRSW